MTTLYIRMLFSKLSIMMWIILYKEKSHKVKKKIKEHIFKRRKNWKF